MTTLLPEHLTQILPTNKNAQVWFGPLNARFVQYEINTAIRMAMFLSQTAHESADYTKLSENLNYSAEGLIATWPKRFIAQTSAQYARQPEKIANLVYADRMGNGNEASGDGWKYRGRGLIQLTGKSNYQAASTALFKNDMLVDNPDLVSTVPDIAVQTACWYWQKNQLNVVADTANVQVMTQKINGGSQGLDDRQRRYSLAMQVLK